MSEDQRKRGLEFQHRSPSLPNINSQIHRNGDNKSKSKLNQVRISLDDEQGAPGTTEQFDFGNGDSLVANHLTIPNSFSNQKSISSSFDQSNLSVIDMYGDNASFISSPEQDVLDAESIPNQSGSKVDLTGINADHETNDTKTKTNSRNSAPTTNDLNTIMSSRKSASKIRLSIEESETKIGSNRDRYGFKKKNQFHTGGSI